MRTTRCFSSKANGYRNSTNGFSLADLLTVLGVLALLALLQFPALAHNKGNSHRAMCADNLRRLALSWLMYADDNRGRLVPNNGSFFAANNWVSGVLDYSGPDSTNTLRITQAKLYSYSHAVEIYRCPDDLSAVRGQLRVRSYSMNGYVGDGATGWSAGFQTMSTRSQIRQPDETFVFIEEHPDSINDGFFVLDMASGPATRIVDFPAAYHYYGANFGFADGSVQYRQWVDARTSPLPRYNIIALNVASPSNVDVAWLQSVSTYRP